MKKIKNIIGGLFVAALTLALLFPCESGEICQDCGEYNCPLQDLQNISQDIKNGDYYSIFQEINNLSRGGTDTEVFNAITKVSQAHKLTELEILAIKAEYYN